MKATIKDVADRSGVSIATVSRVINGASVVSEKSRNKVLKAIEELDFKPNQVARNLVMQKNTSYEGKLMYLLRSGYYKLIHKYSDVEQIEHFTGFGLYDRSFVNVMRDLHDPIPFLRGVVAELGCKIKIIPYHQEMRRAGKTHNNWYTLYDAAMLSFTSYTKVGLRIATILGVCIAAVSLLVALIYLILKLSNWYGFEAGTAPIVIGMFFLGAVQLIFLGIIGEYILSMNQRIMNRPLVVEEERINFDVSPDE